MQHSTQILIQAIVVGSLLLGVTIGGTLTVENLPSGWRSSLNVPTSPIQQFNSTTLAEEYDSIFSLMNANQFSNASLLVSSLSFVNYPPSLEIVSSQAVSQVKAIDTSLPLASSLLGNTVDLISLGLLENATAAVSQGCEQAAIANSSILQFQNFTTPSLSSAGVPVGLYLTNLAQVRSRVTSVAVQCTILSGELRSAFHSTGTQNCVKLGPNTYCLALTSLQQSALVGGSLIVRGSLLQNNTKSGMSGDTISFYLNGTYVARTTTGTGGEYFANLTVPLIYSSNASIWAVASGNSSLGLSIAIGSNAIFVHLLFNSTRIILDGQRFFSRQSGINKGSMNYFVIALPPAKPHLDPDLLLLEGK